jgi:hypothetical protein
MPPLRPEQGLAAAFRALSVLRLRASGVSYSRNRLSGHADAVDGLVPGHVVDYQPEERGQRVWPSAGAGLGQLSDGLDVSAQTAAGHDPAWPGPANLFSVNYSFPSCCLIEKCYRNKFVQFRPGSMIDCDENLWNSGSFCGILNPVGEAEAGSGGDQPAKE